MNDNGVSTFSMTSMCIGSIIGGGIFGSLCVAVDYAGTGIFYAFLFAYVLSVVATLPGLLPSSITPAANGYYTVLCRVISPYLGVLEFANLITLMVLNVALASTFATYFAALIPVNETLVTCVVIAMVSVMSYLGYSIGAKVQNIMTGIMVIALLLFVVMGIPHVDPANLTLASAIKPEIKSPTLMFAAVALLMNCLDGGDAAMILAEKVKNPRKSVITVFLASTSIVCVLYFLMSIVVVGVNPQAGNLSEVASCFMGKEIFSLFIICGALFAIITTINCVTLAGVVRFEALARDKLLPEIFERKNRFGQSYAGLAILSVCGILIAALKLPLGTLFSVLSALSLFMTAIQLLPIFFLSKKYPHSWAHSPFRMPLPAVFTMVSVAFLFCMYEAYSLVVETAGPVWIALAALVAMFYVYFFLRKRYLAGKGIDLIKTMSAPLPEWLEKEAYYAAMDK